MTDTAQTYLLMKRGLYYAPDRQGYTGVKARAGRYRAIDGLGLDGVTAIHEDDAAEFSPACWPDTKEAVLRAEITRLTAELNAQQTLLADATQALADLRSKPYAPWPVAEPDDTVGAMIDNQAWIMMSHIASFIGHRDGQPDLMEQWQDDWAENYPRLLKDWFSPHRAAARYVADRLTVREGTQP